MKKNILSIENIKYMEKQCRVDLTQHVRNLMLEPRSIKSNLFMKNKEQCDFIKEKLKEFKSPTAMELNEHLLKMTNNFMENNCLEPNIIIFSFDEDIDEPDFIFWCNNLVGVRFTDLLMTEAITAFEIFKILDK